MADNLDHGSYLASNLGGFKVITAKASTGDFRHRRRKSLLGGVFRNEDDEARTRNLRRDRPVSDQFTLFADQIEPFR
jgi:hypothetical protein